MTTCNHCEGTGFLNVDQVPSDVADKGHEAILKWMNDRNDEIESSSDCSCHLNPPCQRCVLVHDVAVCDCCGDGDGWYGEPGHHYGVDDPPGPSGPYASNGGLCCCH